MTQAANLAASASSGVSTGFKNRIINGAMQIWQRGTSQTFTNAIVYGSVDRWAFIQGGGSASISQTQSTDVPSGFQYSVKQQRTASSTTTGTVYSIQEIESVNCYDMAGQTATLSFWAKCGSNFSASGSTLTSLVYQGTGTDQGTTSWISGTWTSPTSNTQSNTLTTTWQRFSQTVTIGASTTEILVSLQWVPAGTAGADDSFYFTGVQLEVGTTATNFEYRDYGNELRMCQRYYTKLGLGASTSGIAMGATTTTTTAQVVIPLHTTMRASPTATISNMAITDWQTYTVTSLSINFTGANPDSVLLNITGSGFTAYRPCFFTLNTTAGYTDFSAEL